MPLLFRQIVDFFHRRQVCEIAFDRAPTTRFLTRRSARPIADRGGDCFDHASRFRGSAERLLLKQSILGLKMLNLLTQLRFPLEGRTPSFGEGAAKSILGARCASSIRADLRSLTSAQPVALSEASGYADAGLGLLLSRSPGSPCRFRAGQRAQVFE